MILSGFTDEASTDIAIQIQATKELGWKYLSARTIGNDNIHEIGDSEFELAYRQLEEAGLRVAEFGTLIGNWSKSIHTPWKITEEEVKRCIPRMQKMKVKYARIMSYAQLPWGKDQYEKERFKRLRMITKMFLDEGLIPLHENCMNWGGFSADHTLRLLEEVPGLKLVFDTGNPLFQKDRSQEPPYPWQDPWAFYNKIKEAISHVHIKDGVMLDEINYTFPGEGKGSILEILIDLKKRDYKGFIAIEPHMAKVFHESTTDINQDKQYEVYIEYGRKLEKLIADIER